MTSNKEPAMNTKRISRLATLNDRRARPDGVAVLATVSCNGISELDPEEARAFARRILELADAADAQNAAK